MLYMMPSSSMSSPAAEPQTFTTMDKDLDSIGSHCQYTYCNQLDFLPFRCESCKGTFCLDHRTENSHKCARAGEWAEARRKAAALNPTSNTSTSGKPTILSAIQCSDPSCKAYINTLNSVAVACPTCNRQYCLKHRLKEDHSCSTLIPLGARQLSGPTQADKAKAALAKLRIWGKGKKAAVLPKPKPSTAASRAIALNTLKRTAKGDAKVPVEKRIYLYVEAEANTTTSKLPKGEYWYNKEWSVGRMLDAAARNLQVENLNNHGGGEEEILRVFHVEAGRLLGFAEKVGDVCASGNTIVLLRGVGPTT